MDNQKMLYAETLGGISIVNGVVHMDFYTQEMPRPESEEPKLIFSHRICMPLRGFISTAQTLDNFIKQLSEKDILKNPQASGAKEKSKSKKTN